MKQVPADNSLAARRLRAEAGMRDCQRALREMPLAGWVDANTGELHVAVVPRGVV